MFSRKGDFCVAAWDSDIRMAAVRAADQRDMVARE
jgi:hypothetical protein